MRATADRALTRTAGCWTALRSDESIFCGLYLVAVVLLLFRINHHPFYPYNWEPYTIWRLVPLQVDSWRDLIAINDGLMTDSGRSPLIVAPIELGGAAHLAGLAAMRVPIALLAALAVPLLWIVGRRLVGHQSGLLAAVLLGLSPVFLLYGRTATNVGVSLVPSLLTIYVLIRMVTGKWGWRCIVTLQLLLVLSAYAYAPIRLLWPLSVILLLIGIRFRRDQTRRYVAAAAVTLVVLPAFLTLATAIERRSGDWDPPSAVVDYYNARGEQVIGFSRKPSRYTTYLDDGVATSDSRLMLAARLTLRNAGDYLRLLVDHDTEPAITDYWNPRGRLYPAFLVPLFLIGLARTARHAWMAPEPAILLVLFLGLSVPMLFTSNVHIGRLIFTLPLQFLLAAVGFTWLAEKSCVDLPRWFSRRRGIGDQHARGRHGTILLACAGLLLVVAWSTYGDFYQTAASPSNGTKTEEALRRLLPEIRRQNGVVVITGEPLISELRILMDDAFTFIDLSVRPDPSIEPEAVPPLYYGVSLEQLRDPAAVPNGCGNLYMVRPVDEAEFRSVTSAWIDLCGNRPRLRLLPF